MAKLQAGADFAITQMLFSADDYLRLRDRITAAGADTPLLPGIMPITSWAGMFRMATLAGQQVPPELVARFEPIADDSAAVRQEGIAFAIELAERLLPEGVPSLHFYTLNRSRSTLAVLAGLGLAQRALRPTARCSTPPPAEVDAHTLERAMGIGALVILLALVAIRFSRRLGLPSLLLYLASACCSATAVSASSSATRSRRRP